MQPRPTPTSSRSRAFRGLCAALGLTTAFAGSAQADPPSALGPLPGEMMANPATPTDLLHRPYLTGDPGHFRSDLASKGITFDLQYINDYFGIVKGDTTRGHDDDWGRVRFTLDVDFGKLAHIDGLSFHITGLNQDGGNAGANIGSAANPSGLVSAQTTRLDSWWFQYKAFNGVVVLKAGQFAQQDFYGVQEYGGSFVMEPLDYAYGNLFGNVHATFDPAAKPAVELQIHPYGGFYAKAMYTKAQSNPYGDQDHHGLGWDTGGPSTVSSEIGYRHDDPTQWPVYQQGTSSKDSKDGKSVARSSYKGGFRWFWQEPLPEVYKLGLYWNFGNFTDLRNGYRIHDNYLLYASINQAIFRESHYGPGYFRGLDSFIGGDFSPGNVARQTSQITGGFRYTGLIPTRDKDTVAFGIVHTELSDSLNTPPPVAALGAIGLDYTSETAIEFNYAAQVTGWLLVQPTFQYYFNTGGTGQRRDACLLGVRTKVVF